MVGVRRAVQDDRGSITAEFAAGLPAVMIVLVLALAALQASTLQVRVVDAAAVAARTLARGDSDADGAVNLLVGAHSLSSTHEGDFVCATVSAPMSFGSLGLAGLEATARSCALGDGP
ncbi:TadE family type IV pilus minor pilin [Subtercola boreus]|uniref:Pilus assembly protein TadE n=1 Tax=Subtercola boreus TaxID=120213 RepID=A0A3E0WEV6_9MICO|nr:TadE family type IV pilus minor pilin [Subtercola boreus]RFA22828.1 hypothetical protein B7R24_02795 [Subtercola boreus]RFA23178.1 hypothetical protein B7R23_02790 [Subtercola boreus]RFA28675.1 hypothetical protein B7R25_02805 [Subtercola boreus]